VCVLRIDGALSAAFIFLLLPFSSVLLLLVAP
jgi:hypothetical protein